jgi:hypothetical protein
VVEAPALVVGSVGRSGGLGPWGAGGGSVLFGGRGGLAAELEGLGCWRLALEGGLEGLAAELEGLGWWRLALEGGLEGLAAELEGLGWLRSALFGELEGSGPGIPASPAALAAWRRR